MTRSRYLIAALAALSLIAQDGAAQQRVTIQQRRGWLGFSYETTTLRVGSERRPALAIVEVMKDSPAERAGLQVGDTVVSINDLRVTEPFMESLTESIMPGDEVTLRVRNGGRERQYTLSAANRPPEQAFVTPRRAYTFEVTPDSIRQRMRVYLDSALVAVDSLNLPGFRFKMLPGGGRVFMFSDSARMKAFPFDSSWTGFRREGVWVLPPDGFRIRSDSLTLRAFPRLRGNFMFVDSMLRTNMDTMRLRLRGMPGGIYGLSGDSLITFEPGNFGIAMLGMRAVGGAELTELNPGLGSYFGAEAGVLVVRVAENTPADHAGLQAGDVIVSANGHDVTSVSALHRAIGSVRPRQPIRLEILRKKVRQTIELRED